MYNPDRDLPDCMMPDGGEACGSYARLYAAFKEQALKLHDAELQATSRNEQNADLQREVARLRNMSDPLSDAAVSDYDELLAERDALALRLDSALARLEWSTQQLDIEQAAAKAATDRLEAYQERTIVRGSFGAKCNICLGEWAYTRLAGELHEDWCPNRPVVVEKL